MTEAGWTLEPKQEGYYWWRKGNELEVLHVWECAYMQVSQMQTDEGFGSMSLDTFIRRYGGEFKGPLTPDSYQQGRVAGLEEAGAAYARWINNEGSCSQFARFEDWCAQQAQEEKGVGDGKESNVHL